MDETSEISQSVREILEKIDNALRHLAKDDFAQSSEHVRALSVDPEKEEENRAFECELSHQLYCYLKTNGDHPVAAGIRVARPKRNEAYTDESAQNSSSAQENQSRCNWDSIDLGINFREHPTYIELGMAYEKEPKKYRSDCEKLKCVLGKQEQSQPVCVLIHFNDRRGDRVRPTFERLRRELDDSNSYWTDLANKEAVPYCLRLAFGMK